LRNNILNSFIRFIRLKRQEALIEIGNQGPYLLSFPEIWQDIDESANFPI